MNRNQLVRKISALATEMEALEKQARKLGLFTNNRDLLDFLFVSFVTFCKGYARPPAHSHRPPAPKGL